MDENNKKCWCYITYAFCTDKVPPLPFPNFRSSEPSPAPEEGDQWADFPEGFQPSWYLNAKFPEDEEQENIPQKSLTMAQYCDIIPKEPLNNSRLRLKTLLDG